MITLTEFLTARIDEDKARADDAWKAVDNGAVVWDRLHPDVRAAMWTPARVLAECEAKRRILDMHTSAATWDGGEECAQCSFHEAYEGFNDVSETFPCPTLRFLALPYADHPDYQEAWRP